MAVCSVWWQSIWMAWWALYWTGHWLPSPVMCQLASKWSQGNWRPISCYVLKQRFFATKLTGLIATKCTWVKVQHGNIGKVHVWCCLILDILGVESQFNTKSMYAWLAVVYSWCIFVEHISIKYTCDCWSVHHHVQLIIILTGCQFVDQGGGVGSFKCISADCAIHLLERITLHLFLGFLSLSTCKLLTTFLT